MNNINEFVGINYYRHSFDIYNKEGVNCVGLIKHIDKDFKYFLDSLTNNTNAAKALNGNKNFLKYYSKIDFVDRAKNDIILIKDKKEKAYTHIGILVDKDNFLHNIETKFGSIVQNISYLNFCNKDFLFIRKKEVKNENKL